VDVESQNTETLKALSGHIRESAEQSNATLSIVSAHIGPNWSWEVSPKLRALARSLVIDGGVDVIHGHSSHHVQGVEFIDGKPVLYGAGPFVDDYAVDPDYRNDLSFIYQYEPPPCEGAAALPQPPVVWAHPIRIREFRVERITDKTDPDWKWLMKTMTVLCNALGSEVAADEARSGLTAAPCCRISPAG
jgi:hypothetical protein